MTPELEELLLDGAELGWESELVELESSELDAVELDAVELPESELVLVVVAGVAVVVLEVD